MIRSRIIFVHEDTGEVIYDTQVNILKEYDLIRKTKSFDYDSQVITWYWHVRESKQLSINF